LESHFKSDHFLCSECKKEKYIVFNSERELQIHEVEKHLSSRSGSRSQKKNAASLKLDINLKSGTSRLGNKDESDEEEEERRELDVNAQEQFPSLDGQSSSNPTGSSKSWGRTGNSKGNGMDNFPSLPSQRSGSSVNSIPEWGGGGSSREISLPSQSRLSEMDSRLRDPFPSLSPGSSRPSITFVNVSWGKPQPPIQHTEREFPSLPPTSENFPSLSTKNIKTVQPITSVWSNEKKSGTNFGEFNEPIILHYGANRRRRN